MSPRDSHGGNKVRLTGGPCEALYGRRLPRQAVVFADPDGTTINVDTVQLLRGDEIAVHVDYALIN